MNKKAAGRTLTRVCSLAGVGFDVATNIAETLDAHVREEGITTVVTPNPEIMMVAFSKPEYFDVLQTADISLPDGTGLFWATTFLKESANKTSLGVMLKFVSTYARLVLDRMSLRVVIPHLHHGSDTFFALHTLWTKQTSPRLFYFGGEGDVPQRLIPALRERFPSLNYVGNCGGYPYNSPEEFEDILKTIEAARPEVVFVALNFPKQERWIMETRERFEGAGVRLVLGFGGTFDFAVGKRKRAPVWMHRLGIEWLWRVLQEPSRLGRIWTAVVVFPLTILKRRLSGKKDLTL